MAEVARRLIDQVGTTQGYCLVLGAHDISLAAELADCSEMRVELLATKAADLQRMREELTAERASKLEKFDEDIETYAEMRQTLKKKLDLVEARSKEENTGKPSFRDKLTGKVTLAFRDGDIRLILRHLAKVCDVTIITDPKVFTDKGGAVNPAVSINVEEVPLMVALGKLVRLMHVMGG